MPAAKPRKPAAQPLRITRVKRTRQNISIAWKVGEDKFDITSRDNPLPSFAKALDALAPVVCAICGLPDGYKDGLTANGAYISAVAGVDAVALVASKQLPDNNRPFNISTPLRLMSAPETEGAANPPLLEKQIAAIQEVLDEAKKYVKGDRAQGQIALEAEEGEEAEDPKQGKLLPDAEGKK